MRSSGFNAGENHMRTRFAVPMGVALSMALLGACSKPAATETAAATTDAAANTAAATTDAAAGATDAAAGATDAGGAVSPPPSPGNDAVNANANKDETALAAGSNSFTEGQARGHLENGGYTDVSALAKTDNGLWVGKAKKAGKTMDVSVDFKGAISAK